MEGTGEPRLMPGWRASALLIRYAPAIGVTGAFVYLVLRQVDLAEVGRNMVRANPLFLVPIVVIFLARYWLRAVRWHHLVRHLKAISSREALPRVVLSQTANQVLPFQLGYVLMIQISALKFGFRRATLFGAEAVERMMDGLVFALFLTVGLATVTIGRAFTGLTAFMLFGTLAGLGLSWYFAAHELPWLKGPATSRLARLWRRSAFSVLAPFRRGLSSVRNRGQSRDVLALTVAIWFAEALLYWMVGLALGLEVGIEVYLFVVGAANIGAGIPLIHAGVGLIFLAQQALVAVGQDPEAATAFAFSLEGLLVVPIVVLGPLAAYDMRLRWRDVFSTRGAEEAPGTMLGLGTEGGTQPR